MRTAALLFGLACVLLFGGYVFSDLAQLEPTCMMRMPDKSWRACEAQP